MIIKLWTTVIIIAAKWHVAAKFKSTARFMWFMWKFSRSKVCELLFFFFFLGVSLDHWQIFFGNYSQIFCCSHLIFSLFNLCCTFLSYLIASHVIYPSDFLWNVSIDVHLKLFCVFKGIVCSVFPWHCSFVFHISHSHKKNNTGFIINTTAWT